MRFDGSKLSFAIVAARFNQDLVDYLLGNVLKTLDEAGVAPDAIETVRVPGSNEIPYAISLLADMDEHDCIIALGVVIAGATSHHETIGQSTAQALQDIQLRADTPVINGIIVCESRKQAEERCMGAINRGAEFARAALEMGELRVHLCQRVDELAALDREMERMIDELHEKPDWEEYVADEEDEEDGDLWKS